MTSNGNTPIPKGMALYNELGGSATLRATIPFLLDTRLEGDALILELPLWRLHLTHGREPETVDVDVYRISRNQPATIANRLRSVPFSELPLLSIRL